MDCEIISRSTQNFLVRRTVEEFVRAIRLLDTLTDSKYTRRNLSPGKSKLDQYRPEIEALLKNGSTQKFIAGRYNTPEAPQLV